MVKNISILGSTGSIGTQTLEVVRYNKDIKVTALAAGSNVDLIEKQIREGRYNDYAILDSGGNSRVNVYVYIDYEKYWKALDDKNAQKYVPKFRPDEIAEICGFKQKVVQMED